ncbi:MAG: site-specific integrase [Christensenella sp.]|nr:site-specific integrase [Christensenella sp.]
MPTRTHNAVWLEKQNRWQIKAQKDGVRKTFTSSLAGRAGKAEANRKADEWLASTTIDQNTKVVDLWPKWADTISSKITKGQAATFWKNHIFVLGNIKIGSLNEGDLQSVVDASFKNGLSKKTISLIRACMVSFVKWCRKNRYTTITTEDVVIPKNAPVVGKKILQPDDLTKLFALKEGLYVNLYKFGVITGLRPGELVGLKWSDVSGEILSVRRSVNRDNEITAGKNDNAKRSIRLGKYELAILEDQHEALKRRGMISPWIFPAKNGDHALPECVVKSWARLCKANGMQPVTMYGLRHTFVSMTSDMPEGLKKKRVGHSKNMDTEGVYGKRFDGDDLLEAEYIENRFDEILKPTQKPT